MIKNNLRIGFIGDVHGFPKALEALILRLEDHGIDRLISLGDLVDRGPDSAACVRLIRTRGFQKRDGARAPIEMVLGNHEDRYLRCLHKKPIPGRTRVPEPSEPWTFRALEKEDWAWLESLPYVLKIQKQGLALIAVHGGFRPGDSAPESYDRDRSGLLARTAYIEHNGRRRFWAKEYDGRFGRALFGHSSFKKVRAFPHALGIDGSKHGQLFGVVISSDEDELHFAEQLWRIKIPAPERRRPFRFFRKRRFF